MPADPVVLAIVNRSLQTKPPVFELGFWKISLGQISPTFGAPGRGLRLRIFDVDMAEICDSDAGNRIGKAHAGVIFANSRGRLDAADLGLVSGSRKPRALCDP